MKTLCDLRYRALARRAVLGEALPAGSSLARHVAGCARCRAAWQELRSLQAELPSLLERSTADAAFSERVWERIAAAPSPRRTPMLWPADRRRLRVWAVAGLSTAAAMALIAAAVRDAPRPAERPDTPHVVRLAPAPEEVEPKRPIGPAIVRNNPIVRHEDRHTATGVHEPERMPEMAPTRSISPPRAGEGPGERSDMLRLNEGAMVTAPPFVPLPPADPSPPAAPEREPGSRVVGDLFLLNPVRLAATGDAGVGAAAAAMTGEAEQLDPRLQQKVTVHATLKLSEMLERLSKATGVSMLAWSEIGDEWVTVWADERPLIDLMRDLRHLHGYYWSRSRRGGTYVYALWQDAQGRAREEAEIQRLALEQQRAFEERIWKYVKALRADDAELKRLAEEDPYLVAKIQHPVVRGGFQLFAALSPDQQAQLTKGPTPSRPANGGGILEMFPVSGHTWQAASAPSGLWNIDPERNSEMAPTGDIVSLTWGEMTGAQRDALKAIFAGTSRQWNRQAEHEATQGDDHRYFGESHRERARVASVAALETATVSLFRAGDASSQAIAMRLDFQSEGKPWWIYSGIAMSPEFEQSLGEELRQGIRPAWVGAKEALAKYRGRPMAANAVRRSTDASDPSDRAPQPADPILDAPTSVNWTLPLRTGSYSLFGTEVLSLLQRAIRRPVVLDGWGDHLQQPKSAGPQFRWGKRPLRALLARILPAWKAHTSGGTLFLHSPWRLKERVNRVPPVLEELLYAGKGPITLDEAVMIARTLTPGQLGRLRNLRPVAIDQMLPVQDLLKLYAELAPAQREALARGLDYGSLTPTQQARFLAFAQQHRPFVQPWRFQQGALRMAVEPGPEYRPGSGELAPASNVVFEVRFQEGDTQRFVMGLYERYERWWEVPLASFVGKPFPFPEPSTWTNMVESGVWKPALDNPRLRKKSLVVVIARPYAEPYVGAQPPPAPVAWSRDLARRLAGTGITVAHMTRGVLQPERVSPAAPTPGLLELVEPGGLGGNVLHMSVPPNVIRASPTIFVVDRNEIVRAVFEGQAAWNTTAVEKAAREVASHGESSAGREGRIPK
jgi:hypothetical protein